MDSLPYLAFKVARVSAYIAFAPGLWIIWPGWQRRIHRLRLILISIVTILVLLCVFAAVSSRGNQADEWDVFGTLYWSSIAGAEVVFCAIIGVVIGKFRSNADTKSLSE